MNYEKIKSEILDFVEERNRKQFHNPKDLATAISIEASELEELFLRKTPDESYEIGRNDPRIKEEFADVFNCLVMFAEECGIDIEKEVLAKLEKNKMKYPVEKSKWKSNKYTEL